MSLIEAVTKPLPLEPLSENKIDDRRLWLGNLDPRVTEYQLLKLLQKHGTIEKFDLLFHRTGQLAGQPRGYAFVTYTACEDAMKAKDIIDGRLLGERRVVVRWANCVSKEDMEKQRPEIKIAALAGTAQSEKKISRMSTIQAIEAKLKTMEHNLSEEFEVNNVPAGIVCRPQPPAKQQYVREKFHCKPYSRRPFRGGRR